jgi:DNA-binding response OmpR family regulator
MLRRPRVTAAHAGPIDLPPPRRFGELAIDEVRHEVTRRGQPLALTAREFALLVALAAQPGRVFSRAQLLEQVWGTEYYDDHVVDVHVANLRHKLEPDPAHPLYIETMRGVGYRFGMHEGPTE